MKIHLPCMECSKHVPSTDAKFYYVEIDDFLLAKGKCDNNHEIIACLQIQKFEILMESGANALNDGFTFEALASFYAALESFYDFCIKVFLHHLNVLPSQQKEFAELHSKGKLRMAERRMGAYLSSGFIVLKKAPNIPNNKIIETRNDVLHNGKLLAHEEALEFGDIILKFKFN